MRYSDTCTLSFQRKLESSIRKQDPSLRWDDRRCAFTLIELSIVLVIISLIAGGVLVSQKMVKNAQIRKTITMAQSVASVVNTFQAEYSCLPGDCVLSEFISGASDGNADGIVDEVYANEHLIRANLLPNGFSYNSISYAVHTETGIFQNKQSYFLPTGGGNPVNANMTGTEDMTWPVLAIYLDNVETTTTDATDLADEIDLKLDDGSATTGNIRRTSQLELPGPVYHHFLFISSATK